MDAVQNLARVPARPPASDLAISAALSVWAIVEAFFVDGPGSPGVRLIAGLAMTVPLIMRRRFPLLVVTALSITLVIRGAANGESESAASFFPALLLAAFSVALYARRVEAAVAGGAFALAASQTALALGFASDDTQGGAANYVIIGVFIASAWTAGWLLRRRVAHAARIEAQSEELALGAVADERARIARELHDVVAHSVSIISVQAGAAEQYIERDPAKARAHMQAVRESAHDALSEMRRLTGVLREEPAGYDPQPGLGRLVELVDQARAGGLEVTLEENGSRGTVPPGVDLAAYRIVQEALTNARKHAGPVAAQVRVEYSASEIAIEVVNPLGARRNGDGSGHGLVGMRERVRVYGGTLDAAPDGTQFRVRARLPRETDR